MMIPKALLLFFAAVTAIRETCVRTTLHQTRAMDM